MNKYIENTGVAVDADTGYNTNKCCLDLVDNLLVKIYWQFWVLFIIYEVLVNLLMVFPE